MSKLPAQFAELEQQFGDWILPTNQAHATKRHGSTMAELRRVYDGVDPHVEEMLDYIDRYPLDDLPEDAKNTWYLLAAYIEVAQAIERWDAPQQPDAIDGMRIKRVLNYDSSPLIP